jgi:hypothetical protein
MFNPSNLISGIKRERDPIFSQLEDDVFSKLKELTKDDIPVKSITALNFVSFEDAIKELVELKNKNLNQE